MSKELQVGAYIRVARKDSCSLSEQTKRIQKWVTDNNHELADIFVDNGYSANNLERPEIERMVSRINELDLIVFTGLDRISRTLPNVMKIIELSNKNNVKLVSLDGTKIDTIIGGNLK